MEDNFIYHYTDLNALLGIISSTPQKLTFWGSRYDCMNDPFDFQFANNRLLPIMLEAAKEIAKELDMPKEAQKVIDTKPYVVSFTKKKDDFLMWRMYNAKVALVLDRRFLEMTKPNSALIDCEYADRKMLNVKDLFIKIDKQISDCINISANTSRISTFIKEKSFVIEREVRLATWDYYDKDGYKLQLPDCLDDETVVEKGVRSRIVNNERIILYKRFFIDKDALVGIIIHSYHKLEYESMREKLKTILIDKSFRREAYENIVATDAYPLNI